MILRLLAAAVAATALLQSQSTIRSGVDLLRLNVTVLDDNGQPVRDLGPDDFVVTIDGKPRNVSFARFYGPGAARPAVAASVPATFATNNTSGVPGRVVIFVLDAESIHPGYEKLALDTAGTLVDRLGPSDSVGLLVLPGKGVELTRDHARVRQALQQFRGLGSSRPFQQYVVSVSEAEGFRLGDTRITRELIERECDPPMGGGEPPADLYVKP